MTVLLLSPHAGAAEGPNFAEAEPMVFRATTGSAGTFVPIDPTLGGEIPTAEINVTYNGFSPEAQTAFQYAVDIWATVIDSSVPIEVVATWEPLGSGVLGQAGPALVAYDFPGAPRPQTFYPIGLANKLAGTDLVPPGNPQGLPAEDIVASFNSDNPAWYYGTDGQPPAGSYDLVTVVLHELTHGLGFSGSATVSGNIGSYGIPPSGYPLIYDAFVKNGAGQDILSFPNNSTELAAQLQGDDLYFHGPQTIANNGGTAPKLYAPATWLQGSSYSHWDEDAFPAGDINSLMTPFLSDGEAIHTPGPNTAGLMFDIGWSFTPTAVTLDTLAATGGNGFALPLALVGLAAIGMALIVRRRQ
ncbi:MAG: hypothetical protein KDD73_06585 [Anaerolineales bacterium]|nr:hypothetical protein [Anaerolineales bacterium]MCB9126862.1 hypothetical protein [Ardenticatenales bacterium]MCB9172842.1 hypothetical protein [Ardenticatenales bacterium]